MPQMNFNFAGIFMTNRNCSSSGSPRLFERRIPAVGSADGVQAATAGVDFGDPRQDRPARIGGERL
jgi:hypothetical protein